MFDQTYLPLKGRPILFVPREAIYEELGLLALVHGALQQTDGDLNTSDESIPRLQPRIPETMC